MSKPIYKADLLMPGNPDSPVGLVTLWTVKQRVAQVVPPEAGAAVGELYSATRGPDPLVRNLVANPSVRFLAVTGRSTWRSALPC